MLSLLSLDLSFFLPQVVALSLWLLSPLPPDGPVVALGGPQPFSGPWSGRNRRCLSFLRVGLWNLPSPAGPGLGWVKPAGRRSPRPLSPTEPSACRQPSPGVRAHIPKTEPFLAFKESISKSSHLSRSPGPGSRWGKEAPFPFPAGRQLTSLEPAGPQFPGMEMDSCPGRAQIFHLKN